jgi:23S rRNA (adenine2503-C2)-methyltransferase
LNKIDIRELTLDELKDIFIKKRQPAFRGQQVYEWLWKKSAVDFEEMTNLSKALREIMSIVRIELAMIIVPN